MTLTNSTGIEYIGLEEVYYTQLSENGIFESQESGNIVVSVDDKWVLFQHSEFISGGQIFLKRNSILTDTTLIPTRLENQFPLFPKIVTPNTHYSVYRPGDDSLYFLGVLRDLEVKDFVEWTDFYSSDRGLYYKTNHTIPNFNFEIEFNGIIDSKGIIVSRYSIELLNTSPESPDISDTVIAHTINRRIVDFTEPENIKELSWYADYVKENGLTYLEEK